MTVQMQKNALLAEMLLHHLDKLNPEILGELLELAQRWYIEQKQNANFVKVSSSHKKAPVLSLFEMQHSAAVGRLPAVTSKAYLDSLPLLLEPLSERELEVLNLLRLGATNQDIALHLTVSLNTVKKHTSNIFSKLGVPNRTQAVYQARKLGLISE